MRRRWKAALAGAGAALLVATVGALMTDLGPWYGSLRQPAWKPPDALFGPAWTIIFALAAIAGVRAWLRAPTRSERDLIVIAYLANGFLNVLWSLLFFRLQRPDWALIEVALLWISILFVIVTVRRHSRLSAWLLVPYLAWVSFAAALNWVVVELNRPFS
ncbi:MAG: TspO/MBR family protein [Burkholderiaceae bacterium]